MQELKIVITGTVGAGKTTAIQAISDIAVVSTDVDASDEVRAEKDQTTVAMDYGELRLDNGQVLKIYGTPGQRRFSYMWEILAEGALGLIILVNDRRQDPVADLDMYLENFASFIESSVLAVGVTHVEDSGADGIEKYYAYMRQRGLHYPLFPIDARSADDVRIMIHSMAALIAAEQAE